VSIKDVISFFLPLLFSWLLQQNSDRHSAERSAQTEIKIERKIEDSETKVRENIEELAGIVGELKQQLQALKESAKKWGS